MGFGQFAGTAITFPSRVKIIDALHGCGPKEQDIHQRGHGERGEVVALKDAVKTDSSTLLSISAVDRC